MDKKEGFPFEDAAELRTNISGWACKTCRVFYGEDERAARWCCATSLPCSECGGRNIEKHYIYCESCRGKRHIKAWEGLPAVAWDGETPLSIDDDDVFLFGPDSLCEHMEETGAKLNELRLVICVPQDKPRLSMDDLMSDYFPPDMDDDLDYTEIEKKVNDWIGENLPTIWMPGKTRPTIESLREHTTYERSSE